ncbi:unnamed protein product [Brassica oleracea]
MLIHLCVRFFHTFSALVGPLTWLLVGSFVYGIQQNIKKNEEFMGITLVLLDKKHKRFVVQRDIMALKHQQQQHHFFVAENVVKVSLVLKLFVVTWLVTLRERRFSWIVNLRLKLLHHLSGEDPREL